MATYLIYREHADKTGKNSSGVNARLANGADEAEARANAKASAPNGETRVRDSWAAAQVSTDDLPAELGSVLFFEGNALHPGALTRGGSAV